MKLASYVGIRPMPMGLGNIAIQARLSGDVSHSEVVFEPGDGVDHLMPDGTCEPDADGALWCASSVGLERMPAWSRRRPGRLGGLRLKRIKLDAQKWELDRAPGDPLTAAQWVRNNEGRLYDWQLIFWFLLWIIPQKKSRSMCSEACAEMLGFPDAWRFDPCVLRAAVKGLK